MHHFESWEHGWFYFPATMCFVMFIIMAICFIYFFRKRRVFFNNNWFMQNWSRPSPPIRAHQFVPISVPIWCPS